MRLNHLKNSLICSWTPWGIWGLALVLTLPGCALVPGGAAGGEDGRDPAQRLSALLAGEYTNHAQVWAARRSEGQPPPEYHLAVTRLGELGPRPVLRLRQHLAEEASRPVRDVRLVLEAGAGGTVAQEVQRMQDGRWQTLAGCTVHWQETGAGFRGTTRGDGCRFRGPGEGAPVTVHREWTATAEGLRLVERAESGGKSREVALELAPVRWFTGWAGLRDRDERGGGRGEWRVERRLRLHDGGGMTPLPGGRADKGHAIRLERLEWPRSGIRMLRLSVVELDSGDVVAYAWAPPGAESIGIHLGWAQAGLTAAGLPATLDGWTKEETKTDE